MKSNWCWDAVNWSWYNTNNRSLLAGKNISEIAGYATGNYSMRKFRAMFKSERTKLSNDKQNGNLNNDLYNTAEIPVDGFVQTPLIPVKLNSAIALVNKIPLDVSVTAQDPLAVKKKQEDLEFLKNKPSLEAQLQEVADQMNVGKVDLGATKHSAVPFSSSPYGLDLNEPDELQVFVDLLYNLAVEASFETALQQWSEIKNVEQIKQQEIKDQFWYGVSCHKAFMSDITGLPDIKYIHPSDIITPYSALMDYSDNPHRFMAERVSVLELFNLFGSEICDEDTLLKIINAKGTGYCACNGMKGEIYYKDFNSFKVDLIYCEIKSVDYVAISPVRKNSSFTYVVTDPEEAAKCENKVWGQNTYCFWWLKNTKYFFGIHKLPFAKRQKGQESYIGFSTNINKTQEKSAVELSIGENEKAQIADIKMQHAILTSLPNGKYIDVRYIRNYLEGTKEGVTEESMFRVLNLAMERNVMLGDTEGFEGKNDGQFKPFVDIPGGLKTEIIGYMQTIADANAKISQYTGINENLIGQKAEELVRNNQALINAGINALQYVTTAIQQQYQKLYTNWSSLLQDCIKNGGKTKEAIINLVGAKKVSLIDALDDMPLHTMGVKVSINENEEWKARFNAELTKNEVNGVINTVDVYMLEGVSNPKDRMALLAVKIKQWEKRQERQRQEDFANQQAIVAQQGQNVQNAVREKGAMETQKIYSQGEVNAKILQLASQLGIQHEQFSFIGKRALQQDRGNDQLDKSIKTLETKQQLSNQEAFKQ